LEPTGDISIDCLADDEGDSSWFPDNIVLKKFTGGRSSSSESPCSS